MEPCTARRMRPTRYQELRLQGLPAAVCPLLHVQRYFVELRYCDVASVAGISLTTWALQQALATPDSVLPRWETIGYLTRSYTGQTDNVIDTSTVQQL